MKPQNNSDMQFEDAENVSGTENLSIKQIVLKNLQTCIIEGSKEMDGGGYRKRIHNGEVIEVLAPNQREVFCNSIDMLWILVKPFYDICKDEKITSAIEEIEANFELIDSMSNEQLNEKYKFIDWRSYIVADDKLRAKYLRQYQNTMQKVAGQFREKNQVILYRRKLICISELLKKLDYFEEGGYSS